MFTGKNKSYYGRHVYQLKKKRTFAVLFFIISAACISLLVVSQVKNSSINEKRELLRAWHTEDYEQAYKISKNALSAKPLDYFLLTINGFSAYQMGISQINNYNTLVFINECIRSLRKALLLEDSSADGRVFYVLGKAYSYKGGKYADLAVKYLETAKTLSYDAHDIPEYLGLAYAACGDYRSSVEAFSLALSRTKKPSDSLLLSMARSYIELEEYGIAVDYLRQCIDISQDSKSVLVAGRLSAEVHFQLGEQYNLKGDTVKARSEWRNALNQDPSHEKAKARLNN